MAPTDNSIDSRCPECGQHELVEDIHTDKTKCGNCKASWTKPEFYDEDNRDNGLGDGLPSFNRD